MLPVCAWACLFPVGILGIIDMRPLLGLLGPSPALAADKRDAPKEARESREFRVPWLREPKVVRRLIIKNKYDSDTAKLLWFAGFQLFLLIDARADKSGLFHLSLSLSLSAPSINF